MGTNALTVPPQTSVDDRVSACLLGMDYCKYGVLAASAIGKHAAVAISVGADESSPSNRFKTDAAVPNEDALCFVESRERSFFAVADAHYGPESSHTLVRRLYDHIIQGGIPETPAELSFALDSLQNGPFPKTESETSLLVAVYDRQYQKGFGVSFGDSSFAVVGVNGVRTANPHNSRFVSTSEDQLPLEGATFEFSADHGDTLLCFTDGINECHYRSPQTSVSSNHIAKIVSDHLGSPLEQVSALGSLALTGVGGHPGGQDNIALIASQA